MELKKTAADSNHDALLSVGDGFQQEIDSATEWELYSTFLRSLEKAFEYSRSVVSFLKTTEKNG